jgi:hypothetical protein
MALRPLTTFVPADTAGRPPTPHPPHVQESAAAFRAFPCASRDVAPLRRTSGRAGSPCNRSSIVGAARPGR